MESGTVRLRSVSALSHALARPRARGEERTTEAVTSTVKEARPLEGSPSKASRKLQKRCATLCRGVLEAIDYTRSNFEAACPRLENVQLSDMYFGSPGSWPLRSQTICDPSCPSGLSIALCLV